MPVTTTPTAADVQATGSARIDAERLASLAARVTTSASRTALEVEQPFTGTTLGQVPRCTPEDIGLALKRAAAAQDSWARTSFADRRRILLRVHDLVLNRQDEVLDLLQLESGKARRHALEEVLDVAIVARYYANTAQRHLGPRRRRGALPLLTATWELHHPVGVVGVIAPWNYPFTLSIGDALPALAAGNAVVLKPDAQTPFSALWGAELLEEAGLPAGLLQVVTGSGRELGPHLIDGSRFLMFTGSTATGRDVAQRCAQRLIPCSMELGGKNAMIVLDDADIPRALEGAERALFSNAGQLCVSIERLLVHDTIADEFTTRLAEQTYRMRLGADLDFDADMGSLISQAQLDTVRAHIDDAVGKGASVLAGGRARPDVGPYFHEPTLVTGVRAGMTLATEETFGPVVAISRFSTDEEAVARANDSDYGLNASVWTGNAARGREIAARIQSGTVNVNEGFAAAWASVDAPMGGMKDSGMGRRHGEYGIRKYAEAQTVSVQRLLPVGPPPPLGPRGWGRCMTTALRALRRLPGVR
jgi:succinate-semialdehyde dehydrogenase / glutarate-semialdehyde dehydrogenase